MTTYLTNHGTVVELYPWEIEWTMVVGMRRHHANLHKQDAKHYDPSRMEDNLTASVKAARCELAVAKAIGHYWSGSYWDSGQHKDYATVPDVEPNIEVRRTRYTDGQLPVRSSDVAQLRVMVQAHTDDPGIVTVTGFIYAVDGWEIGKPARYDTVNTRLVSQSELRPIAMLR